MGSEAVTETGPDPIGNSQVCLVKLEDNQSGACRNRPWSHGEALDICVRKKKKSELGWGYKEDGQQTGWCEFVWIQGA